MESMQKVKFLTGFGGLGGSTIALIEHCKLLNSNGYDAYLYSFDDWCVSKYEKAKKISEFKPEEDDILVYHLIEQSKRPRCKKCFLYLHEKGIWDLKYRVTTGFDEILFVSDSQKKWHATEGTVIPNPMSGLVNKSLHNPPNEMVAGVVGTIQQRKRQHVSIQQAILDGSKKVLLFGDIDSKSVYYDQYIKPLLSDNVVYRGVFEPERRMDMYNEFDTLYIHSYDESASLVLGECKILGKNVVKEDSVEDYEIASDEFVMEKWRSLFESNPLMICESKAFYSSSEPIEKLVCVVTHNRKEIVSKWLRAWNNADKCGAKIAVLHAFDGEEPSNDERDNILQWRPDYYIPFRNNPATKDMQALMLVIKDFVKVPNWNYLFWFTDDCMPMKKDFLKSFDKKIQMPQVGIVTFCYEPNHSGDTGGCILPHIRTIGYALKRESADKLSFPTVGLEKDRPYLFEHGRKGLYEDHILNQIVKAGFSCKAAYSDTLIPKDIDPFSDYVHWTEVADCMWDCHLFANGQFFGDKWLNSEDLWDMYERQFVREEQRDPLTIFSAGECERITLLPKKICAIIPTYSSPMNYFMWSVFSLFLRSDPRELEHVIFGINGPDARYPDQDGSHLQDRKQCFIEDLRSVTSWERPDKFNPGAITLVRTWSRIGHSQTIEQCINWVHTQYYLLMHDDIIVMDKNWTKSVYEFSSDPKLIAKTLGDPLVIRMRHRHDRVLELPHLSTTFSLFDKPKMKTVGAFWNGYYLNQKNFMIKNYLDFDKFIDKQKQINCLDKIEDKTIQKNSIFDSISMEIGTFAYYAIVRNEMRINEFPASTAKHFFAGSSRNKAPAFQNHAEIEELEAEIMAIPEYAEIYLRYKENVVS